jgi:hypothetical protein
MVDYVRMREEYIQGTMHLKQLADKYEVSINNLRDHSNRHNWGRERKKYQAELMDRVMKRHEVDILNELAIINGQDLALTKRMRQVLASKLSEIETSDDVSLNDLATMARLHKDLQHVGRIALDANSDAVRTEIMNQNKDKRDYSEDEIKLRLKKLRADEEE